MLHLKTTWDVVFSSTDQRPDELLGWPVVRPSIRLSSIVRKQFCCLHSSIRKSEAILTKLCHNVCDHKVSDEFDNGLDQTDMSSYLPLN